MQPQQLIVVIISALTIAGMLLQPWQTRDWQWTALGGVMLVLFGLVHPGEIGLIVPAWLDVAAFLTGMMMLAELARTCAFFDWFAGHAARAAGGSSLRLFGLLYLLGICVTAFLSNDATAIVLTPAVAAVVRKARIDAWPYVLACALIANAASLLLPIANPANLVFFGTTPPQILPWLRSFLLPSIAAISVTFGLLVLLERKKLRSPFQTAPETASDKTASSDDEIAFTPAMAVVSGGIAASAIILLVAMQLRIPLGLTTLVCGSLVTLVCRLQQTCSLRHILRHISWSVIALTGGLFLIVAACNEQHCTDYLARAIAQIAQLPAFTANLTIAGAITVLCALANNLPIGLLAHHAFAAPEAAQVAQSMRVSALVAVNLGPNLAVSGSLATILWMDALRREGIPVNAGRFFRAGVIIAPLSLGAAIACIH